MRQKLFTEGVTVFFREEVYEHLKKESDEQKVGMSELIRNAVYWFLQQIEETKQKEMEEHRQRELRWQRIPEEED